MEIGDVTMTNFTVEFRYVGLIWAQGVGMEFRIGTVKLVMYADQCYWYTWRDNEWQIISGRLRGAANEATFRMVVSNNTYTITLDGSPWADLTYGTAGTGPVGFTIKGPYPKIDWVTISAP
jgi:hypothetical protein